MTSVNNSVETINAAATAIVTAESRVQPTTEKRRWISRLSIYGCFGIQKTNKRINHAVLAPEPIAIPGATPPSTQTLNNSTTIVLPFIAPPSSPSSFLQSDPSSETHSPAKFISLTSLTSNPYSPRGPANIYAVGPYANETQLVSPPVFSAFPTEPSTAPYTPPPESVQMTTPSSPEVPFAELLTSSLNRSRRNNSTGNYKLPLSQYEYQPYQMYNLGSPGSRLVSPGSANRWGSRLGSGTLTPEGAGLGSRLGSGSLTPDGCGAGVLLTNQISEVASLANSANGSPRNEPLIDHRVSFELTVQDFTKCLEKDSFKFGSSKNMENVINSCVGEAPSEITEKSLDGEEASFYKKHRSITLGSIKEFDFENTNGEILEKGAIDSEWWANEKVVGEDGSSSNWTFFPMIQPEVK